MARLQNDWLYSNKQKLHIYNEKFINGFVILIASQNLIWKPWKNQLITSFMDRKLYSYKDT